tara:strand:+ start:4295 stop:5143 length:849 start_codon:yes stop_codon:yes gene_type:complete
MKKPDTLFLSGGGVNCLAFLGSLQYLIEKEIINENFQGIKNIVCVSGSSFHILPLLLGYTLKSCLTICLNFNNDQLIDYTKFDINNLLENYGMYDNDFLIKICSVLLEKKNLSPKITLKEFYDHTKINFYFKTSNLSKSKIVYLSHKTFPELPLIQAIQMTTCLPLIFKPIQYKGDYYVDGGLCGNFPIEFNKELKSKNYLGIYVSNLGEKEEKILTIFDYIGSLYKMPWSPYDEVKLKKNKKIITILMNKTGLVFTQTKEEKEELLRYSYKSTMDHFNSYS